MEAGVPILGWSVARVRAVCAQEPSASAAIPIHEARWLGGSVGDAAARRGEEPPAATGQLVHSATS